MEQWPGVLRMLSNEFNRRFNGFILVQIMLSLHKNVYKW